ncbi:SDR family oxidoreductase [Promineifilum sp.]|uniref:SDR family oxidoreductase n=1 Tax=Promineifilum sp. TaxID=2664178 RepID=UPI0035B3A860
MTNLFSLDNKTAVVTGALGLIGRRHCEALAAYGANVIVADLEAEACAAFAATLPAPALGCALDVTDPDAITALRDAALARFGHLDVLVNNAAINDMFESPAMAAEQSRFESYPLAMWQKSLDANVTGVFLCSQILGAPMAAQGRGSIINVASTYGIVAPDQSLYQTPDGRQPFYKSPAYPTTKGAVIAFTRFLAAYWGSAGVRVNTLSPGGVENNQHEYFVRNYSARTMLGRMALPTDYQGALVFLASDASAYMTGANLVVDGGWTAW